MFDYSLRSAEDRSRSHTRAIAVIPIPIICESFSFCAIQFLCVLRLHIWQANKPKRCTNRLGIRPESAPGSREQLPAFQANYRFGGRQAADKPRMAVLFEVRSRTVGIIATTGIPCYGRDRRRCVSKKSSYCPPRDCRSRSSAFFSRISANRRARSASGRAAIRVRPLAKAPVANKPGFPWGETDDASAPPT